MAAIEELAAAAADLPVSVRTDGDLTHQPAGVELSAYRIVQEALTNVRRHAGPVHHVDVSMVSGDGALTVEVTDDGRGAAAEVGAPGFGLVGMRERVAACDGQLFAGPRPGGGWRVRAVFPVGVR
jgi:signal transduction histidine kinase